MRTNGLHEKCTPLRRGRLDSGSPAFRRNDDGLEGLRDPRPRDHNGVVAVWAGGDERKLRFRDVGKQFEVVFGARGQISIVTNSGGLGLPSGGGFVNRFHLLQDFDLGREFTEL